MKEIEKKTPGFIQNDITPKKTLTYAKDEDLSKKDLDDMKNIFTQDDNEILDIPSMINIAHTQKKEN